MLFGGSTDASGVDVITVQAVGQKEQGGLYNKKGSGLQAPGFGKSLKPGARSLEPVLLAL